MGGGTEAFPDLGEHCSYEYCKQLDFLPFRCDGCKKVFCLEHRTYKDHDCPNAEHKSRVVVVCQACSASIEKASVNEEDEVIRELHKISGDCDATRKQKPRCPVNRCKEILTFSNNCTCKICNIKVCLKHRFPADHNCKGKQTENSSAMVFFQPRCGTECGVQSRVASPPTTIVPSRWSKLRMRLQKCYHS